MLSRVSARGRRNVSTPHLQNDPIHDLFPSMRLGVPAEERGEWRTPGSIRIGAYGGYLVYRYQVNLAIMIKYEIYMRGRYHVYVEGGNGARP